MPEQILKHILLVIDAAQPSQPAINTAIGLARQTRADKITIAFIVDMNMLGNLMDMHVIVKEEMTEFIKEFELQGKNLFRKIRETTDKVGVKIDPVLCQGRFYQVVLQCVKQFKADSVVIGGWENATSHKDGRSIERQLVADQVSVPVIIVK